MKERPILFSASMVRAILDGRKTQTRRIVKPPAHQARYARDIGVEPSNEAAGQAAKACLVKNEWSFCPYGKPGDRLWVRETFAGSIAYERQGYPLKEWGNKIWYIADGEPRSGQWTRPRPSIHMPRGLSRITLEITEVRVERLQDISEADALAEGLKRITKDGGTTIKHGIPDRDGLPGTDDTGWPWRDWNADPRVAFRRLWESINGPGSWAANPWVWVVGFRRVTQ